MLIFQGVVQVQTTFVQADANASASGKSQRQAVAEAEPLCCMQRVGSLDEGFPSKSIITYKRIFWPFQIGKMLLITLYI